MLNYSLRRLIYSSAVEQICMVQCVAEGNVSLWSSCATWYGCTQHAVVNRANLAACHKM